MRGPRTLCVSGSEHGTTPVNQGDASMMIESKAKGHPSIRLIEPGRIHRSGDTDFSDFQTHLSNRTIPAGVIWLNSMLKREDHHVALALAHLEWRDMKAGLSLSKSLDRQRRLETKMRRGDKDHDLALKLMPDRYLPEVESSKGIPTYTVNGEAVRNLFTTDGDNPFEQGGHDLRYAYIAAWARKEGLPGAHWIDSSELPKSEWPPTAEHEIRERNLMAKGMGYEAAHKLATADEKRFRVSKTMPQ